MGKVGRYLGRGVIVLLAFPRIVGDHDAFYDRVHIGLRFNGRETVRVGKDGPQPNGGCFPIEAHANMVCCWRGAAWGWHWITELTAACGEEAGDRLASRLFGVLIATKTKYG